MAYCVSWIQRWFFILFLLVIGTAAKAESVLPELQSPVTDLSGTLPLNSIQTLNAKLLDFQTRKGPQVAVLILNKIPEEYTIEEYALKVAEKSRLGRVKIDDWVLTVVALQDRKVRVEVGYGAEGVLTDYVAFVIGERLMAPRFKSGDIEGGINAGVDEILRTLETGVSSFPPPRQPESNSPGPFLLVFGIVIGSFVAAVFGRILGGIVGGGITFITYWYFASLLFSLGAALLVFILVVIDFAGGFFSGRGGFPRVILGGGGFGHGSSSGYGLGSGRGGGGGATVGW